MAPVIEHQPSQQRFAAQVEGQLCVADYQIADGVMHLTHTGVPASLRGRGIAAALIEAAIAHARQQGLKVNPLCSYAEAYMRRHPETAPLRA